MFKNIYFYRARFFPALITSIPMLIFFNKIIGKKYSITLENVNSILPIFLYLGLSSAIIFLCVQVNRLIAKEVVQRFYFKEDLFMPTTNHLLFSNNYFIDSIKDKIRNKINAKFNIILLDIQLEQQDEIKARKLIAASVSQIRITLKDNTMLLQHNIEYGFWRNFIGGSFLAVVFSTAAFLYGISYQIQSLKTVGLMCLLVYLVPIFLSKLIINYYGNYYSKILYEQFLNIE